MSERSEHLIERAAAKLRGGVGVQLPGETAPGASRAASAAPPMRPFTPVLDRAPPGGALPPAGP